MATPQQADADPVEVVLDWLREHPQITPLLGGPDHVSGIAETPWPHLAVDDGPGGDMRDFRWDAELEVTLELTGHPNGAPGKAELRRQIVSLCGLVAELPERQVVTPTTPVVSRVRPSGTYAYLPLTNGQPRMTSSVYVTIRPPRVTRDA